MTILTYLPGTSTVFDPLTDMVNFSDNWWDANQLEFIQQGADLLVGVGGQFMTLLNTSFSSLSSSTIGLASGSLFLKGGAGADNLAGSLGNDFLYGGPGNDTLSGGEGNDMLSYAFSANAVTVNLLLTDAQNTGDGLDTLSGIDTLVGSAFSDTLTGNNVGVAFDGGAGADTMTGGDGSDYYNVRDAGDVVIETNGASDGTDIVAIFLASYTLTANVERGYLFAETAANLTGNALDNYLFAGWYDNVLDGLTGNDTVEYVTMNSGVTVSLAIAGAQATAYSGMDTLISIENLGGTHYADRLTGNTGANHLEGYAGNDSLYGGTGNDTMSGSDGADTYSVQDAGDVVIETNTSTSIAESDLVYSYLTSYTLASNVEQGRVMLNGLASLTGNGADNILFAGIGSNVLNGAGGNDTLSYAFGAASGVTISLALAGAQATGGSGSDTVAGIENLVGSAFADQLGGSSVSNVLNGGAGNDTMSGGDGADEYSVQQAGDVVIETNASTSAVEMDLVNSHLAAYTLGANVEHGRVMLDTAANLAGNAMKNTLYAGLGANVLDGAAGIDTVSYAYGSAGVSVNLSVVVAQNTLGSGLDQLIGIENLVGTDYDDYFQGSIAANLLEGAAGNDWLNGGGGNDTMIGGDGYDIYEVSDAGDVVVETNAAALQTDLVLSFLANYTLTANVENAEIRTISPANLTGNALNNILYAGAGDNVLNGAGGSDTANYTQHLYTSGITLNLALAGAQATGGSGSDTLIGIENLVGTNFADKFAGNSGANELFTGNGDDSLYGGYGDDTMSGGRGADIYSVQDAGDLVSEFYVSTDLTESDLVYSYLASYTLGENVEQGRIMHAGAANLSGNMHDNKLFAGPGSNVLIGGTGTDAVSYAFGASSGVTVSLAIDTAQATGGSGTDTLSGFEILYGSDHGDYLSGNSFANLLSGGAGGDGLYGGAGNDVLDGGTGIDSMNGGDGADVYYVRDNGDSIVEANATVSAAEYDTVYSYAAACTLGANIEKGAIMIDTAADLTGNASDNLLFAGAGANTLIGGTGIDTVDYDGMAAGVTVSLALAGAQATGGSGSDTLSSIENLRGSDFSDVLIGDSGVNALFGWWGDDTLDGGLGDDSMTGGGGRDVYWVHEAGDVVIETNGSDSAGESDTVLSGLASYTLGANIENGRIMMAGAADLTGNARGNTLLAGKGNNVIHGAGGLDTVSYESGASNGVTVSLALTSAQATGGSGSDTLLDIDNVTGTGFADKLTGSTGANALSGGFGNDSLYGGTGIDTMTGGDGADIYSVQDAGDVVIETVVSGAASQSDLVYSYLASYTLGANVEQGRVMLSGAANLSGNAHANTLFSGSANNVLDGATGSDTVSYAFATAGVTVSLALAGAQATGGSGSDTLVGVENLAGSSHADQLTGSSGANTLTGGAGVDVLSGGAGNDIFTYASVLDSGAAVGTRDTITDFVQGQDKIDLSLIDANTATVGNDAFTTMLGSAVAFTAAGQLRVTAGVLYINTDADADAEAAIVLTGVVTLTIGDFIP
jgi:Ca2+-binding RTX toxin-like protein